MKDNFSGNINQPSTHRAGIGANRYNWGTDIFFERFEQKMADQHHIIPGCVGRKPLEGQLLMPKILDGPVGQFVTAAFVVAGHKPVGRQIICRLGFFKHPVDRLTLTDVGDDDRIWTKPRQIKLLAVIVHQPTKDSPTESLPGALPATELGILPGFLLPGFKPFPMAVVPGGGHPFNVFIHLAATKIADVKCLTNHEDLLIEKTAVHTDDDRYIPAILPFDFDHHVPNHVQHAVPVIGVLVTATKHRIDNEATPVHLQGLKSLFLFVGRFDAVSALGIVIVHNHRIDAQFDHIGPGDLQAPDKKGLQRRRNKNTRVQAKAWKKRLT